MDISFKSIWPVNHLKSAKLQNLMTDKLLPEIPIIKTPPKAAA
jgi:hypothetical protein